MSSAGGKVNKKRKNFSSVSIAIAKGDALKTSNPKPSDHSVSQKRLRINQSLSSKLHELTNAEEMPRILQSHGRITGAKNGNVWNFKISTQHEESLCCDGDSVEEVFDGKQPRVIPSVEHLRHRCVSESRDHLRKLCLEQSIISPLMAWERWQANCMLTQQLHQRDSKVGCLTLQHSSSSNKFSRKVDSTKETVVDYILPSSDHIDEGLVLDLLRGGVKDKEQATKISRNLTCQSKSLVEKVKEFERACKLSMENPKSTGNKKKQRKQERAQTASMIDVLPTIMKHKHTYDVSFGKVSKNVLKLNCAHYVKLKELYVLTQKLDSSLSTTTAADNSEENENTDSATADISADSNMREFYSSLYVLLARYNALLGHGMQCALPEEVFDVLHDHVKTNFECFASPLNCRYPSYCSAFPDTDAVFGSKGSFFNFYPTRGSYEVNPPFIESIMTEAVKHAHSLLSASEDALSFTFIVPGAFFTTSLCWMRSGPVARLPHHITSHHMPSLRPAI